MGRALVNDLASAEQLANDLLAKLTTMEERLMAQAQLKRATG